MGSGNFRLDFLLGVDLFAELIEGVLLLLEFEEAGWGDVGGVEFGHGKGGIHVVLLQETAFELGGPADGDDASGGAEEGGVAADLRGGHVTREIDIRFQLGRL